MLDDWNRAMSFLYWANSLAFIRSSFLGSWLMPASALNVILGLLPVEPCRVVTMMTPLDPLEP